MDIFAVAKALFDAGGWGACVVLVLAIAIGLFRGPASKLGWVPGWMHLKEARRADDAETALTRNTEALEQLSRSVDTIIEAALRDRAQRG